MDGAELYLTFEHGRVVAIHPGPSWKTPWHFALRANAHGAAEILGADAAPRLSRYLRPGEALVRAASMATFLLLVKNLRFFKEFMALGRAPAR